MTVRRLSTKIIIPPHTPLGVKAFGDNDDANLKKEIVT